jgi:glutathione S-transferase
MTPQQLLKLYRASLSGHSHRAQLFLSLLGLPVQLIDVDLRQRAHKSPEFLALNRFGQVPVLDDAGLVIADSNAILVYLAERYDTEHRYYPTDPALRAEAQRWLSVAAGALYSGPCVARLVSVFGAPFDHDAAKRKSHELFELLEAELSARPFLVAAAPSIADVALYSYTAHAPEGGVSLEAYPAIRRWLARIEALPGFVGMQRTEAKA